MQVQQRQQEDVVVDSDGNIPMPSQLIEQLHPILHDQVHH